MLLLRPRRYFTRVLLLALLILLTLLILIGCAPPRPEPPEPLRVTFLDVGQGDALVVQSPGGRVVVVDGGGHPGTDERRGDDPGHRVVAPFLRSRGISRVDLLIATHPDDDHVQGLIALAEQFTVKRALISGYNGDSAAYSRLLAKLRAKSVPIMVARRGQTIPFHDGARLEILHPGDRPIAGTRSPGNDNSIVLRLVYGAAGLLLTGDAEEAAEEELLRSGQDLSADVLKVGHHGSRYSSGEAFLRRVRPRIAVVSAGRSNVYGHPSPLVLERLERLGIRIYRTDRQGAIQLETEGRQIAVRRGPGIGREGKYGEE